MPAPIKNVPAQTVIFKEGDPAEEAYVVMRGSVELYLQRAGKVITLGTASAGQCFGEMGPLSGHARISSARTRETTELIPVSAEDLRLMLNQRDPIARVVVQALVQRIRQLDEDAVQALLPKFSLVSLARLLLLLNGTQPAPKPDPKAPPSARAQAALAAATGSSSGSELARLPYEKTVDAMAEILNCVGYRVKDALQQLEDLNLITSEVTADGRSLRFRPAELVDNAARLEKSLGALVEKRLSAEVETVDLDGLARECGVAPDVLFGRLVAAQAPRELYLFRRTLGVELVRRLGLDAPGK